jgi:O-antigen/teichoic acid export membrane protein
MLAGTVLVGLSGYVFFAVIGHDRFEPATAAALAATYLLSNILGPGVFIAAEQESSRVVSSGRASTPPAGTGDSTPAAAGTPIDRTTVRRLALICAGLGVLTLLVLGIVSPVLLANVLDGDMGLLLALMLAVIGSAAVYYIRGLAGGQQRFHRYAATTGIDGGARIVGCVTLAAAGTTNPVAYALALCAGPAVAAVCTARGAVTTKPAHPAITEVAAPTITALSRGVAYLLVASFVSLAMANLAPVIVTGLTDADPAAATGFAAAVVLTRVPLLLMGPIQALLLPRLTLAADTGRLRDFRRDTGLGLAVIGVLAVVSVAVVAVLGRWALDLLVGAAGDASSTAVLILLTVSAMLQMAVQFLQPALIALRLHRMLVVAWLCGGAVFALSFLLPIDPIDRGVLAQLAGPVVTMVIEVAALGTAVGRRVPARSTAADQHPE